MSLKLPNAPAGTQEIVSYAMQRAHKTNKFAFANAIGGAAAVVTPVAPHQVYVIGLKDLVDGLGLKAAKLVGWRAIVLQGSMPVSAVEFTGAGADPKNFKSVNQGPQVQSTATAISVAESISQTKANDYEVRLLQMAAIYLASLWLYSATENLFIPMDPSPSQIKANTVYSESAFFEEATQLARRRIEVDDRPKGTPPVGK